MSMRFAIAVCALLLSSTALAQDASREPAPVAERGFGNDRFSAGPAVRIAQPVTGDLFAAGGSVDIEAPVTGDALAAGGNLRIGAPLGESLYAAGGQLRIDAPVARNARVAGGRIELGPGSKVAGNLTVAGGAVELRGAVGGHVLAAAGELLIDGEIGGDVTATAGTIELGPNARVGGRLRYAGREEIRRDAAAQVAGGIERVAARGESQRAERLEPRFGPRGGWVWTLGLMLLAALLVGALPEFYSRVSATAQARPAASLIAGFAALACVPIAAVILFATIVGIPLALIAVGLYLALLVIGYASAGVALGDWALKRVRAAAAAELWWRVAAAILATLAIALVARVP
ncbi:MAG: polymer-forming cytoskeletal protein [Burkholderiaceae bacterium]